ncbi:hypothetical protein ABW20_dc0104661 [Dactylellina cionopaga]|nr:hypothetical protein ABW20_dc0104661 [Dactylellina cionopaga]
MLDEMCDIKEADMDALPDVASQPVLGLSNKAVTAAGNTTNGETAADGEDEEGLPVAAIPDTYTHPPFEDTLSRQTLWPEEEKLYGHGYEISTSSCTNAGDIVATACKASSVTHAVIRLFETKTWRQLKPPLEAHTLTVNRIAFSGDDVFMLSVGRDRQWCIFERAKEREEGAGELESPYKLRQVMGKAQTRVIFDGKWAPLCVGRVFVTAARDKMVKVWGLGEGGKEWECTETVKFEEAITAIDILDRAVKVGEESFVMMAVGLESGSWSVYRAKVKEGGEGGIGAWERYLEANSYVVPDKAITQISWRPAGGEEVGTFEVAISSEDSSVRIYELAL